MLSLLLDKFPKHYVYATIAVVSIGLFSWYSFYLVGVGKRLMQAEMLVDYNKKLAEAKKRNAKIKSELDDLTRKSMIRDKKLEDIKRQFDKEARLNEKLKLKVVTPTNCVDDDFLRAADKYIDQTLPIYQRSKNGVSKTAVKDRGSAVVRRFYQREFEYIIKQLS